MSITPISWTYEICFCAEPSQPYFSIRRLSDICPSSRAMKNAPAPICGISHALPNTAMAPHTPPSHIHHGFSFLKAMPIRPSLSRPTPAITITMVAMKNDVVEACTADPRQRPNRPYMAPIDAMRPPVMMAESCQSCVWRLAVCDVFPFPQLGITTTDSTPATSRSRVSMRMAEIGIRMEPKSPKWSMIRLNRSCPSRGRMVVCNCPSARNRQVVMVMVHRAMMPPVRPHQGVLAICAADGSNDIPMMAEITASSSEETMNEMSVTTQTGPMLVRIRALAAVCMGTSIPINSAMVKKPISTIVIVCVLPNCRIAWCAIRPILLSVRLYGYHTRSTGSAGR